MRARTMKRRTISLEDKFFANTSTAYHMHPFVVRVSFLKHKNKTRNNKEVRIYGKIAREADIVLKPANPNKAFTDYNKKEREK